MAHLVSEALLAVRNRVGTIFNIHAIAIVIFSVNTVCTTRRAAHHRRGGIHSDGGSVLGGGVEGSDATCVVGAFLVARTWTSIVQTLQRTLALNANVAITLVASNTRIANSKTIGAVGEVDSQLVLGARLVVFATFLGGSIHRELTAAIRAVATIRTDFANGTTFIGAHTSVTNTRLTHVVAIPRIVAGRTKTKEKPAIGLPLFAAPNIKRR